MAHQYVVVLPQQWALFKPGQVPGQQPGLSLVLLSGAAAAPAQPAGVGAVGAEVVQHGILVVAHQEGGRLRILLTKLPGQRHGFGNVGTPVHQIAYLDEVVGVGVPAFQQLAEGLKAAVHIADDE